MIALLVMTDGRRDCIASAIPAALDQLHGPITRKIIHDDSADPDYRTWLERTFTDQLLVAGKRFAFWGERADGPWVTHIGDQRVGTGY